MFHCLVLILLSDLLALRQATPASPVCLQSSVLVSWRQLSSDDSDPLQRRSSIAMGTLPCPKKAFLNGIVTGGREGEGREEERDCGMEKERERAGRKGKGKRREF